MLWKDLELLSSRCAGRHNHRSTKPSSHSREVLQVEACEGLRATPGRSIHNILKRYTYGRRPSGCDPSGVVSTNAHLLSLLGDKCEYAPEMNSFTQPATVPLEAFLYGSFEITKRAFSAPRRGLVSFRYHFRALSGQCTLSSGECSFKLSKNTELGVKDKDWFLSSKREGRRRTPPFSHLRWLGSILQEWTQLTCLADASCMRKAVLMATDFKGAARRGSSGGPARYLSTVGRSHVSLRVIGLAATTKIPFKRVERSVFEGTMDPSGKTLVYSRNSRPIPCKSGRGKGFPLCQIVRRFSRNSATSVKGALTGSTPLSTHHLW